MLIKVIRDYGVVWVLYRIYYLIKIRTLNIFSFLVKKKPKKLTIDMDSIQINREQLENSISNWDQSVHKKIIRNADNAAKGKILAFNHLMLNYGDPFQWHYNPLTKKSIQSHKKWFEIPDFSSEVGDIKLIWEPSRLFHLYYFSQAFILTKDTRYYEAFSNTLASWKEHNAFNLGPNFKCGQEATIRMVSALINYGIFDMYGLIQEQDKCNLKYIIETTNAKIQSNYNYSYYSIKNNHTISETVGGMIVASLTNNHNKFIKWRTKLEKIIEYQFLEDGGYIQNSFNYQLFALEMISLTYTKLIRWDVKLSKSILNRIIKSIFQLSDLMDKRGSLPNYGPNDSTKLLPFGNNESEDIKPRLNYLSAVFLQDSLFPDASFGLSKWLLREEPRQSRFITKPTTNIFNKSGIAYYDNDAFRVWFFNKKHLSRPTHIDNLHFTLNVLNKAVFIDSGTYSYASQIGQDMIALSAHNAPQVESLSPMSFRPPFFIYDWLKKTSLRIDSNILSGSYTFLNHHITREINVLDSDINLTDSYHGPGQSFQIFFTTPYFSEKHNHEIIIHVSEKLKVYVKSLGSMEVRRVPISYHYHQMSDGWQIVVSKNPQHQSSSINTKIYYSRNGD